MGFAERPRLIIVIAHGNFSCNMTMLKSQAFFLMIVILGSTGYIGGKYLDLLRSRDLSCHGLSRSEIDYSDLDTLRGWLVEHKPDFLINAAGYTGKPNVDACEDNKAECLFGNAILPGIIGRACEENEIPWGHVSSGCIYQGRRPDGSSWTEEDSPNFSFQSPPCSFYSGAKALGEEELKDAESCYVWRLRVPFNHEASQRNYLMKILTYDRLLEVENSLSHVDDFVDATLACWEKQVPFGIYNVTNPGTVTTRQIVDLIKEKGLSEKEFTFFESEEQFMQQVARSPRSSCALDASKLTGVGIKLRSVEDAIGESLVKMKANHSAEVASA